MSDFLTNDNIGEDIFLKLFIGKAETNVGQLIRLCEVGSLLEDLIAEWDDESPQCVQSQEILRLFLEDLSHHVETLQEIVRETNKEAYKLHPIKTAS